MALRNALKIDNSARQYQAAARHRGQALDFRRIRTIPDRRLGARLLAFKDWDQRVENPGKDSVVLVAGLLLFAIIVGVAGLAFDSITDVSEEDRNGPRGRY